MRSPLKLLFGFGIIASIILTGCNNNEQSTVAPVEEPVIEYVDPQIKEDIMKEVQEKVEPEFSYVYPLTGLGTNNEINNRIFAVMVNNHPKARPQSGLHKADIVYEILAEGFITRYLAVFQSELPDVVGPVRSARDYYIYLSKGLGAIYVAYGGSPEAFDLLQSREITDYIGGIVRKGYADDPFFYRANFRKAPHNVYITKENLLKGAETRNYSITQVVKPFRFLSEEEIELLNGEVGKEVRIVYSNSYSTSFKYVEDSEMYQRYTNGEKSLDRETEKPIMVDNIIIIEAPHRVVDNAGRRDINLQGNGRGLLFQKGIVQQIKWENVEGRITPFINGQEVGLVPGRTWVNVVPTSPGLEKMISFSNQQGVRE